MYEVLWRSNSHLFAASVTSLAYSRYAADYNYTEGFAGLYEGKELTFYLDAASIAKRVARSQEYFSQQPNLKLYLQECHAMEKAYRAFYYSLADDYSAAFDCFIRQGAQADFLSSQQPCFIQKGYGTVVCVFFIFDHGIIGLRGDHDDGLPGISTLCP